MKLCPVCGHENSDNSTRCTNPECGYKFNTSPDNRKTRLMDDSTVELSLGNLISGRYEIVKELGRGGMGVVYLVKDSKLRGREMALKMIHPELITHEEARQRFIDEVLLCLDLHHPNIVIVYPIEESDRSLFFTMEYIPGQSLRKLMDDRQGRVPLFTLEESCTVINQILDALAYAHQTTIHRDIKPENIIVQGEFPDVQVKVLDFGIAKVLSASRFTRTAQSMGTAYYMSPEQMQGAKKIDMRSDLYSVGMVLYEMLTGVIAAGRFELPGEIIKGLPPELDKFIEKVLSPRPEVRFDSARSMKQSLLPMPDSARKASVETLNRTVMDLLSKAAFDQAQERIKQSGLSADTLLDKVRGIEDQYSACMDKGKTLLSASDFQTAREQFNSALGICPDAKAPHTGIRKVDDAVKMKQKKEDQHRAEHEAREKERREQAAKEKARAEKQIHEAIVLCDENITRADFDTARQNLSRAEAIDAENPVCIKARDHLEKTESQYNNYIDQAVDAMASRNRTLAEDNLNKALDICPKSDKAERLKMELENAGSVSRPGRRFVLLFLFLVILAGVGGVGYFTKTQSSKHVPAKTGDTARTTSGAKVSQTDKPAEPVRIQHGSLRVTSTPKSAIVTLNGRDQGSTPLEITDLNPGNMKVEAGLDGYLPQSRSVYIAAGDKTGLHFDLEKRSRKGKLTVNTSPAECRVRILNIQPRYEDSIELDPGRYRIEVSCSGYATQTQWIELGANEVKQIKVELEKSGPSLGQSWKEPMTGMEFVWVPKGCYQMGDTFGEGESDEKPVHEVCLDGFWMGKYEVTQAEYRKVTGKDPSEFNGDRRPVERVSWEDAKAFISKLNRRTGQTFSLPTEAQWEYAAREGGKKVRFGTGKNTIGPDEANFNASSKYKQGYSRSGEYRKKTVNVGNFLSNRLGLYDMSGNVWEWCEDVYDKGYKRHSKNNPVITSGGSERVLRGGSWYSSPGSLRAAYRRRCIPSFRYGRGGFRLVLVSRGQ